LGCYKSSPLKWNLVLKIRLRRVLAHPIVGPAVPLAHRTLSGAHGQSDVPNRPLARATRRPLITLVTVGSGGSDSLYSPVIFSRGAFSFSREHPFCRRASLGHRIVRCTTECSGLADHNHSFFNPFSLFLVMSLTLR
jgi:hypothetical protein